MHETDCNLSSVIQKVWSGYYLIVRDKGPNHREDLGLLHTQIADIGANCRISENLDFRLYLDGCGAKCDVLRTAHRATLINRPCSDHSPRRK